MKKFIKSSTEVSGAISAIDLADEFYGSDQDLRNYLDSLPVGTKIVDIVNAPGSHWAGTEAVCEKRGGYKSVYYNRFGLSPSDTKYDSTWWSLSGSEINEFDLSKIILKGTKYYCTRDVFEGDDF